MQKAESRKGGGQKCVGRQLRGWEYSAPLVVECSELIAIVTTIVKKVSEKLRRTATRPGT